MKKGYKLSLTCGALVMATALSCGIGLYLGSNARTSTDATSYVSVGELWDSASKTTNDDNVRILMKYLTGKQYPTMSDVDALAESVTNATALRANVVEAGTQGTIGYSAKSSSQNIEVTLGGLTWQVCYLSKDKNGDTILTLWLADAHQDAFVDGRTSTDGQFYGFQNGVLYSDWSANWNNSYFNKTYPSNMYGTSYIRAVTLNNGGLYATSNTATAEATQTSSSVFAMFTMDEFGLTYYLVAPRNVSWQEYQSAVDPSSNGYSYSLPNDAWGDNIPNTGEYNGITYKFYNASSYGGYSNYSTPDGGNANTNAKNWIDDYIWLPSMAETGYSASKVGLWGLNNSQRAMLDGSTTSTGFSVGKTSGTAYNYSWLRSGYYGGANSAYYLYPSGSSSPYGSYTVYNSLACRPALHFNLSSAAPRAAARVISFESNGGSKCGDIVLQEGDKYTGLPTPTKNGGYFSGWYFEPSFVTKVTNEAVVVAGEATLVLYAKWESNGYTIEYDLKGGLASISPPTGVALGAEFSLSAPTKAGHTFAGWRVSSGLEPTTAKWGLESALTPLESDETICRNLQNGPIYFLDLGAVDTTVVITALWAVDADFDGYEYKTFEDYLEENAITDDMSATTITGNGSENSPYQINSTNDFYYAFGYLDFDNKYFSLNSDIYLNDEIYSEGEGVILGDGVVYQFTKKTTGAGMTFEGNGHTIYGLYYSDFETSDFALFSCANGSAGKISGLNLQYFYIKVSANCGVVAYDSLLVEDCHVMDGTVIALSGGASGVAYKIGQQISDSTSSAYVYGGRGSSGIVSTATENATISTCTNAGKVTGEWGVGGIIGSPSVSTLYLINCKNYGLVTGSFHVGGIVGAWFNGEHNASLIDCGNYGNIKGFSTAGGLIACAEGTFYFENCENFGNVTGQMRGAFIGDIVDEVGGVQSYQFTACRNTIYSSLPLIGRASAVDCEISIKKLKIVLDGDGVIDENLLLSSVSPEVKLSVVNAKITGRCKTFNAQLTTGECSVENLYMGIVAETITPHASFITNSAFTAEGVIVNINSDIMRYYGTNFSAFNISWKSGQIGLNALDGIGQFCGRLTEEQLKNMRYLKKEIA